MPRWKIKHPYILPVQDGGRLDTMNMIMKKMVGVSMVECPARHHPLLVVVAAVAEIVVVTDIIDEDDIVMPR